MTESASVVQLVTTATNQDIPHQEKIDILTEIEQFIETLIKCRGP